MRLGPTSFGPIPTRAGQVKLSSRVSRVGGKTNQIEPLRFGPSKFSFMKMWRAAASKFTTVNYYCEPKNFQFWQFDNESLDLGLEFLVYLSTYIPGGFHI